VKTVLLADKTKNLRESLAFSRLAVSLVIFGVAGVTMPLGAETGGGSRSAGWASAPRAAAELPREKLSRAGLAIKWEIQFPLARKQQIDRIFYRDGQLYVLTDGNALYALAGDKGTFSWQTSLGSATSRCSQANYYQDRLLFAVGKTFVEVRCSDGAIVQRLEQQSAITTTPARTGEWLFLGNENKIFQCLRLANGVPLWSAVCPEAPTANVALSGDYVYFITREGTLYVSSVHERLLIWRIETPGPGPGFVIDNNQCFIPSADTALYALDARTGEPIWPRYLAGGHFTEAPVVTTDAVYQSVARGGLLCLNRADGSLRWRLQKGRCLLAENGSISYAMTVDDELAVMNNKDGKRVLSFYLPGFGLYVRNNQDPMIFLANAAGAVAALEPKIRQVPAEAVVKPTFPATEDAGVVE